MSPRALIGIVLATALCGCSGNESAATKQIQERPEFAEAITLVPEANFEPSKPCVAYPHPGGRIANFGGNLLWADDKTGADAAELLRNNKLGRYNVFDSGGRTWTCFIFAPGFRGAVDKAAGEMKDKSLKLPDVGEGQPALAIAYRTNIRLTYTNQYESDLPEKGKSKILATTCEYDVAFFAENLSASGKGKCEGKWFMDNDTGKWTVMNFEVHDPDILLQRHVSGIAMGNMVISRDFQNGAPVEPGTSFNNPPTAVSLMANYTKGEVGSDLANISIWSRGGATRYDGCADIAIRFAVGWVECKPASTLNPGDYEFHLQINGQPKGVYPFTVTNEHISRLSITNTLIARTIENEQPVGGGAPLVAPSTAAIYVSYTDGEPYRDVVTMKVTTEDGQEITRCSDLTVQYANGNFWCNPSYQFSAGRYRFVVAVNNREIGSYAFLVVHP